MKAIKLYLYKNPKFELCSNHGITENEDTVFLVCDDGDVEINEEFIPVNAVVAHKHGEELVLIPYGVAENLVERCEFGGSYARSHSEKFKQFAKGAIMLRVFDRLDNDAKLFGR